MSHIDQIKFIKKFSNFYIKNFNKNIDILEVGSLDINGNVRNLFSFSKSYIGIDLIDGKNVDLVMDGAKIDKLNKKFDLFISCECFEHAENWKEIFQNMIRNGKKNSIIILTMASTGRIEHGTSRSGSWQSPGTKNDYYQNLTKMDFYKNFHMYKIFSNHFFFYNINSYDLYFVGLLGHYDKSLILNNFSNDIKFTFKKKKLRKILNFLFFSLLKDNWLHNFHFYFITIKFSIFNFFKKLKFF